MSHPAACAPGLPLVALGLAELATQQGMRTLWQNGLRRALNGETALEEVIRVLAADML